MSQWADRILKHSVWQHLAALGPSIDQARGREDIDPQTVDSLERVRTVLAFVGKRLATADPFTTLPGPLDGLSSAFQNALSEVQAFVANGSAGHVTNANTHVDAALQYLAQVAVPGTPEELASLRDAATAYRVTLEQQLAHASTLSANLRSDAATLKTTTAELGAQITAEKQQLSQLTSTLQAQFSSAQEARSQEFAGTQTARQEKHATLIADYQLSLTEQNAEFTRQKELALEQYQKDVDKLKTEYSKSATGLLKEIEDHRARVEKLVGVIGNLGVTSGYLKTANHARKMVCVWQVITVLALAGLIAVAYKAFLPVIEGGFTWSGFVGRALLTLTVGVLAAYAAKQADKFFDVERRSRKMALELEAIGPYLAPLPQEKQDLFRIALGEKSFGREDGSVGRQGEKSPATVVDVVLKSKELREAVTGIVNASRQG